MIKDRQGHIVKELEGQNKLLKKLYSTSAGRCALKILVSPFVTHLGGLYMSSPFSKTSISSFIKNNDIDMSQYEEKKYKSYNDFFTRRIKDGQRPFDNSKDVLMAPADSKLTYYPINDDTILEIKDTKYQLKDLLQDETLAKEYDGGICLVFRLAVDDYHRYSYVDDGQIVSHKKIKGILFDSKGVTVVSRKGMFYIVSTSDAKMWLVLEPQGLPSPAMVIPTLIKQ